MSQKREKEAPTAMWARTLLFVLALTYSTDAYKILVVSPVPSKSHNILGNGLVRHLSQAGHEITYITAYPAQKPLPGVKVIDVSNNQQIVNQDSYLDLETLLNSKSSGVSFVTMFLDQYSVSEATIENPNVQKLLNDESQKFDLVVAEWMFHQIYAGFSAVFDCPYVWFSTIQPHWGVMRLIDEMPHPAYTSDPNSDSFPPFTFIQRVKELGNQLLGSLGEYFVVPVFDRALYEKSIAPAIRKRGRPVPSIDFLQFNASLMLGNSHVSLGSPTRLPESYKHIGGYHIEDKVPPLTKELQNLMDNAKHGVIYFSMGTNVKSKTLPDSLKQSILKMFGELKQTVLWKFEEDLPNRPKNVHILQWAPQQSILAHKNCLLFVTHGGLLSISEVIHFGVPIIGIPVFTDQFGNVERAVNKGFAKRVDLSHALADDLREAIKEVLTDKRYRETVKELSFIYHDRPVHPGKEMVHWVEHVIKTNGAPHLRSPALMMPWYQKNYFDLLTLIVIFIFAIRFIVKTIKKLIGKNINSKKKIN